ncbi:hypothetical protein AD26_4783 [Escherichia coli 2-156-04_S4_C3]|nr:hypothetical protein AD26_4783 [Escherichia coli 2-156-04_S4_C3]
MCGDFWLYNSAGNKLILCNLFLATDRIKFIQPLPPVRV